MAFTNSLKANHPGFGIAGIEAKRENVDLTASATIALPVTGGFARKARAGWARFKAVKDSGTSVTVALRVAVSDGTITRLVANFPASAADETVDYIIPILADFGFDRVNFIATTGGTTPDYNVDVEFVGTSN